MTPPPFPAGRALFGSQARAAVLGLLADSPAPKSGYAIAKSTGISFPKVYGELRRLRESGWIAGWEGSDGVLRYALRDEDLRRVLLKRVRIASAADWFSPDRVQERLAVARRVLRMKFSLPSMTANPAAVPNRREFRRAPGKDRALRKIGARARSRAGRRRQSAG